MDQIRAYCRTGCKACNSLKSLLEKMKLKYEYMNISTPEALTELSLNGVFAMSAPVLQIGKNFYTTKDICLKEDPEQLDQNKVIDILKCIVQKS